MTGYCHTPSWRSISSFTEKLIVLCIVTHHRGRDRQKRQSTNTSFSWRERATTTSSPSRMNACGAKRACGCRFVIEETFVLICRQLGGTAHLIFIGNGRINQLKEFQGFVKYQLTFASLMWRSMLILAS